MKYIDIYIPFTWKLREDVVDIKPTLRTNVMIRYLAFCSFSFLPFILPSDKSSEDYRGIRLGKEHNGPTIQVSTRIDRMKSRLIVYFVGSVGYACPYSCLRVEGIAIMSFPLSSIVHNDGRHRASSLRKALFCCHEWDRIHNWMIEHLNYSSRR